MVIALLHQGNYMAMLKGAMDKYKSGVLERFKG